MYDNLDTAAPDFAETFIAALREQGEIPNTGWLSEDDDLSGVFEIREFWDSDSPVMDESNMATLTAALEACAGYADGYLTALDAAGKPTPALLRLAELLSDLADYPLLDESDYSDRQCDAASEHGLDVFGDDMFEAWRKGELTQCAGWCGDPDTVPAPDVQPDAKSYAELTGDALAFIQGHAQCRYLESECCY